MLAAHPVDVLGREADHERRPVEIAGRNLAAAVGRWGDADGLEAGAGAPAHRQPVDRQGAGRDDLDVGDVGGKDRAGDDRPGGVARAQDEDHFEKHVLNASERAPASEWLSTACVAGERNGLPVSPSGAGARLLVDEHRLLKRSMTRPS